MKALAILLPCFLIQCGCSADITKKPSFRFDLSQEGLRTSTQNELARSYCNVGFLSNDLIIVSINQRRWTSAVEASNTDFPASKALVIDIKKKTLVKSGELHIEKEPDSFQVISNERFVIRNESGIQICDVHLVCEKPVEAPTGPLIASPAGTTLVVGGYADSDQLLFDLSPLSVRTHFARRNGTAIPGDGVTVIHDDEHNFQVKRGEKQTSALPLTDKATGEISFPHARLLNDVTIGLSDSPESLAVLTIEGNLLYQLPVSSWYEGTSIFTSSGGKTFGLLESSHTSWNSITHFYGIDETRPYDFERIRVLEIRTGRPIFEISFDPRPYVPALTLPALSPDGQLLAVIRHGALEIYSVD